MFATLAIAFIVVPIVEIAVLMQVGGAIGGVETLVLVIVMAVVGASLARRQGLSAMQKLQRAMATGHEVGPSMVEGVLVLVAAVLMITPGFVTDGVGLLLLVPPVRRAVAAAAQKALLERARGRVAVTGFGPGFGGPAGGPGRVGDGPSRATGSGRPAGRDDAPDDPPPPGVIDV